MTLIHSFRDVVAKGAAYVRTRCEIANLPVELAVEDLGIFPGDAD